MLIFNFLQCTIQPSRNVLTFKIFTQINTILQRFIQYLRSNNNSGKIASKADHFKNYSQITRRKTLEDQYI